MVSKPPAHSFLRDANDGDEKRIGSTGVYKETVKHAGVALNLMQYEGAYPKRS